MRVSVAMGGDGRPVLFVDGVRVGAAAAERQPQPGTPAAAEAAREIKPIGVSFAPLQAKAAQ